jgi:hypothetical protein
MAASTHRLKLGDCVVYRDPVPGWQLGSLILRLRQVDDLPHTKNYIMLDIVPTHGGRGSVSGWLS